VDYSFLAEVNAENPVAEIKLIRNAIKLMKWKPLSKPGYLAYPDR
jgi:hypothetical protein